MAGAGRGDRRRPGAEVPSLGGGRGHDAVSRGGGWRVGGGECPILPRIGSSKYTPHHPYGIHLCCTDCCTLTPISSPLRAIANAVSDKALSSPPAAASGIHPAQHEEGASALLDPGSWVCRALVVMDRSLVKGQSALTLVVPPGATGGAEGGGGTGCHAVRGLQLGPGLAVCPPSR